MNSHPLQTPLRKVTQASIACFVAVFVMASDSEAAVIGFNLNITATSTNANFGTGVTAGDTFTGMMFFDSADLTPDGTRQRSNLLGGDSLTSQGVSLDAILNSAGWSFGFVN